MATLAVQTSELLGVHILLLVISLALGTTVGAQSEEFVATATLEPRLVKLLVVEILVGALRSRHIATVIALLKLLLEGSLELFFCELHHLCFCCGRYLHLHLCLCSHLRL